VNYTRIQLLAIAFLWLNSGFSVAGERTDFQINDDGGAAEQRHPRIAVAVDRNCVISWTDKRNGHNDIYLQSLDSGGWSVGSNERVNDDTAAAYQSDPAVTVDPDGFFAVAWTDYRHGDYPFGPEIYFQRLDSLTHSEGANTGLTVGEPEALRETPDIDFAANGRGVVVWADYRNNNWDIYGQLVSRSGLPVGDNFKINTDVTNSQQHWPRVSVAPCGWFVVAWYDNRSGNDDIYMQQFDSLAAPIGINTRVNSDASGTRQAFPDVAADGIGHFTVVWVDWRNGFYPANPDIYARKFNTSLTALSTEFRVNTDGTDRAQREPTIAADFLGNVAIIWSDSTGSSWDINGQMIDVDGVVRESNFRANTDSDSAQLQADVALDGRFRYVTWTDRRNGNWDIYASIRKYNDPTLTITPTSIVFRMDENGDLPTCQALFITHAGYNPLSYTVISDQPWCQISPRSGITPDTVGICISVDTLARGSYLSYLRVIDNANDDSSVLVPVRLEVIGPELQLSADTVLIDGFAGSPDIQATTIRIENTGAGSLFWSATENVEWLSLSPDNGTAPADLVINLDASKFPAGTRTAEIIVDGGAIPGSPDTVWVVARITDSLPYIRLVPDSFHIVTQAPAQSATGMIVANAGAGELAWRLSVEAAWLLPDRTSGSDGDTVMFTVDTSTLVPGQQVATITVTDTGAFNPIEQAEFVLDWIDDLPEDSLTIGSGHMAVNGTLDVPVFLTLGHESRLVCIPIGFDHAALNLDSVTPDPSLEAGYVTAVVVDSAEGSLLATIGSTNSETGVPPARYEVFTMYMTAGVTTGSFPLDTVRLGAEWARVVSIAGSEYPLVVIPGQVTVDINTGITDSPADLPGSLTLAQNFPNPFNGETNIAVNLPRESLIRLEIFNILGQQVKVLASGRFAAGNHLFHWAGDDRHGAVLPSGIYFYRLRSDNEVVVRKLALVK
jgi:hypothetical protein